MKKNVFSFLLALIVISSSALAQKKIVLLHDGNTHDRDDIGALPMALAIVKCAEAQGLAKLVHCSYNNHHWADHDETLDNQRNKMTASGTQGQSNLYPVQAGIFFNARTQLNASVNHLANLINNAGSGNNLLYICSGGPQDQLYRALAAANASQRQFVRIISHSTWNNNHDDGSGINDMQDIQNLLGNSNWNTCYVNAGTVNNPTWNEGNISNQNSGIWSNESGQSQFNWMQNDSRYRLNWVYDRIQVAEKWDVSDAGMAYWVITGNQDPSWNHVKNFFDDGGVGFSYVNHNSSGRRLKANATGGALGTNPGGNTGTWVQWMQVPVNNTWFYLVHKQSLKKLRCTDGTTVNTAPTSNAGNKVQWRLVDAGGGWYRIQNRAYTRWLHVQADGVTNFSCGPTSWTGNNTKWQFSAPFKSAEVTAVQNNLVLEAFPNPASDKVTIAGLSEGSGISVYSVQGKLVYKGTAESASQVLETSTWGKGLFLIQVRSGFEIKASKVIVE